MPARKKFVQLYAPQRSPKAFGFNLDISERVEQLHNPAFIKWSEMITYLRFFHKESTKRLEDFAFKDPAERARLRLWVRDNCVYETEKMWTILHEDIEDFNANYGSSLDAFDTSCLYEIANEVSFLAMVVFSNYDKMGVKTTTVCVPGFLTELEKDQKALKLLNLYLQPGIFGFKADRAEKCTTVKEQKMVGTCTEKIEKTEIFSWIRKLYRFFYTNGGLKPLFIFHILLVNYIFGLIFIAYLGLHLLSLGVFVIFG